MSTVWHVSQPFTFLPVRTPCCPSCSLRASFRHAASADDVTSNSKSACAQFADIRQPPTRARTSKNSPWGPSVWLVGTSCYSHLPPKRRIHRSACYRHMPRTGGAEETEGEGCGVTGFAITCIVSLSSSPITAADREAAHRRPRHSENHQFH